MKKLFLFLAAVCSASIVNAEMDKLCINGGNCEPGWDQAQSQSTPIFTAIQFPDGSTQTTAASGVGGGADNLGTHIASKTLDMSGFGASNANFIDVGTNTVGHNGMITTSTGSGVNSNLVTASTGTKKIFEINGTSTTVSNQLHLEDSLNFNSGRPTVFTSTLPMTFFVDISTYVLNRSSFQVPGIMVFTTATFDVTAIPTDMTALISSFTLTNAELFAMDGADNTTKLSSHDRELKYVHESSNRRTGKTLFIPMEDLVADLEKLTGKRYIYKSEDEYYGSK